MMTGQLNVASHYRIQSFCYDDSNPKRLLFTLTQVGGVGELRLYADEIAAQKGWVKCFSITEAAIILYALEDDGSFDLYKSAQRLLTCVNG